MKKIIFTILLCIAGKSFAGLTPVHRKKEHLIKTIEKETQKLKQEIDNLG